MSAPAKPTLRAVGWDNPRCSEPMLAAAAAWRELTGVTVDWEFRSLSAFNDQPLAELAGGQDLLVVDHPAIPEAVEAGAIVAFDELFEHHALAALRGDGVGPSAESYRYGGSTWALAVDGACHVSAGRREEFSQLPVTWEAALATVKRLGRRAALPLTPADALCALLTLAATLDQPVSLERPVSLTALETLAWLAATVHPCSWECSPPALLKRMRDDAEIVYVPLVFGYASYSGASLRFGDTPAAPSGRRRPILGGAGLAVSASSRQQVDAASFCSWVCGRGAQREVVLSSGGQPASGWAWSVAADAGAAGEFFAATSTSIRSAWVRPQHPDWAAFQRAAADELAAGLRENKPAAAIRDQLWQLARALPQDRSST